ncbi:M81 family metallopeptidase [Ancylobacter sp. Lp-2]|uniref:M81 family metallopeptidase n=1 Tax=Ancylobacter sp. Lp-2 TaxID=2881339 RepID=UPI001E3828E1|nr:M81 family metallopeptidase [Ancylobacter sp. Lp-2]MCB4767646.1 M81 family metallopeptidase [Ancylobacter sp. Lp-2]
MAKIVLTAQVMHETNTFSKNLTGLEAFRRLDEEEIPRARRGTRTSLGATFDAAEKYGWTLRHPLAAWANPSGRVTTECFEALAEQLLRGIAAAGPIDGMLLHLHGAMVTERYEDGEGELLRRVRSVVGPDIPIVATLDLHANVTDLMVEMANALIPLRTYPHIDYDKCAWQGADLLDRAMTGEISLRTIVARRPLLLGLDFGKTQGGPMAELLARADALEQAGAVLAIGICSGFASADIREAGPTVTVTVDGEAGLGDARRIAEAFMDYAWETRAYRSAHPIDVDEAVRRAKAGEDREKPVILADFTDNPGGGCYGDSTNLLKGMIEGELENAAFYAICDPEAVREGTNLGVGEEGTIRLGGKTDPMAGGGPLTLTGRVLCLSDGRFIASGPMGGGLRRDYGLSMVFRVGGVDIVVISKNGQATDLAQFTSLGVDPTRKHTLAIKSNHHFRAAFEPIAREVLLVDSGSLGSSQSGARRYVNVRRPIWPLDV